MQNILKEVFCKGDFWLTFLHSYSDYLFQPMTYYLGHTYATMHPLLCNCFQNKHIRICTFYLPHDQNSESLSKLHYGCTQSESLL